jgi:hypothetical protein
MYGRRQSGSFLNGLLQGPIPITVSADKLICNGRETILSSSFSTGSFWLKKYHCKLREMVRDSMA